MRNPVVGVDLGEGAAARVVFAHTYPRTNQLERSRRMAIFGANESDLSDRVQLSEELGGFPFNAYDWQCNTTTIQNEAFRYVFLLSPTDYDTFGNIAEVGFYGYSEQDIVDSGILIPPTEVACATNFHGATLSWDRGWNAESYVLERRIAGSDGPWKRLVTLATDVHSYEDASVPRSGTWEWRITAEAEGKDPISSLPCAAFLDPHLGAVIIIQ